MRRSHAPWLAIAAWVSLCCGANPAVAVGPGAAAGKEIPSTPNRPPEIASYTMRVRLDTLRHRITGAGMARWTNATTATATTLRWHLYQNAFRDRDSAYAVEARRGERDSFKDKDKRGSIELTRLRVVGAGGSGGLLGAGSGDLLGIGSGDLLPASRYVDADGFPGDRTVLETALPYAVPPGASVEVEFEFTTVLAKPFERSGWIPGFYFASQWFPKLGVFSETGWNCHAYHAATEFFADFGTYDVTMDVPESYVVGATGTPAAPARREGQRSIYRFRQAGVHDFAWVAAESFSEVHQKFSSPGLPETDMTLFLQPEHRGMAPRYFKALTHTLEIYGRELLPYPYPRITVIDPPRAAKGVDGMEYPTLFTAGCELFDPATRLDLEDLIIHEFGHQWFYGIVASNEFEFPFLDEGLNTWATYRLIRRAYGPEPWSFPLLGLHVMTPGVTLSSPEDYRHRFFGDLSSDTILTPGWRTLNPGSTYAQAYSKTTLALGTLERLIGRAAIDRAMRLYVQRFAYRHPRPEDLFAALEEASGGDLSWFIDPVFRGTGHLDYAVTALTSERRGKDESKARGKRASKIAKMDRGKGRATYESRVDVRRLGSLSLPVAIELRFADGGRRRLRWDGAEPWMRITVTSGTKLVAAIADPDHRLVLDANRTNNSRRLEPDMLTAKKWGRRWLFWVQNWLLSWGAFA